MKKWIGKGCAVVCLLGTVAVAPACGDDETQCESGQLLATYNGETSCFNTCDGACSAGSKCVNGLCVPDSPGTPNGNPNNGTPGNSTPGNSTPGNSTPGNSTPGNSTPGNSTPGGQPTAETIALCEKYADLLYGSCLTSCTLEPDQQSAVNDASDSLLNGDGTAQNPGCAQLLTDNPPLREEFATSLANATCADFGYLRCGRWGLMADCGSCTPPTNLGARCTDHNACNGGSLQGYCWKAQGASTGVCIALECPALTNNAANGFLWQTDVCGTNGVCQHVVPADGSEYGMCIQGCTSDSECSNGACQPRNFLVYERGEPLTAVRVCMAACRSNLDCNWLGVGARCSSTGSCQFACDGTLVWPNEPDVGTWEQLCTNNGGTCTMDAVVGTEFCVL